MELTVNSTIQSAIEYGSKYLAAVSDSAKLDSQILLAFCLHKPTSYLLTWPEQTLSDEHMLKFQQLVARRYKSEPIAYIVGEKEFWSLPFKVSPATLIPRPDTEVLVEQVLNNHSEDNLRCLDLGTGTGAIALALASEKPDWIISAVDLNNDAVKLANENAKQLKLTHVGIYQSNWFDAVPSDTMFDIVVSNPPYIDKTDENLSQGDVQFEPNSALISPESGLQDIRLIAEESSNYLKNKGCLYIEHGFQQAAAVAKILSLIGYKDIKTVKDYNGNDRITFAKFIHTNN